MDSGIQPTVPSPAPLEATARRGLRRAGCRPSRRLLALTAVALCVLAMIASEARGPLVGFVVGLALVLGLYQFSRETWASVGGSGDPAAASAAEQTRRAQMLYARSGAGQWPECGRHLR